MKTLTEFSNLVLKRAAQSGTVRLGEGLEGDALVTAMAGDLQLQEDRVRRLIEALEVAGENIDNVRLIRVFQGETAPAGATSKGEFHYVVDRVSSGGGGRRDRRDDRRDDRRGGGGGGGDRGGFGGRGDRKDKPRGLGSLKAAASGAPKEDREDRARPGEIPRVGIGWQLQSAPRDPRDNRGGGRGGPRGRGRPGDRRGGRGPGGPGGDRPGGGPGGDRPGGGRGPRGPRPEGANAGPGGGPGGPRPEGDRGPRRDRRDRGPGPRGPRPAENVGSPPQTESTSPATEAAPVTETTGSSEN